MTLASTPVPERTTAPTPAPTQAPPPAATTAPAPTKAPTQAPLSFGKGTIIAEPLHEIPEKVDPLLVTILAWPREHESFPELQFCKWLREHIQSLGLSPVIVGGGNLMVTVPRKATPAGADPKALPIPAGVSSTLFSCHVDTVEGGYSARTPAADNDTGEPVVTRKSLTYDPNFGLIALEKDSIGGSLGADDGAGVWLMLEMLKAGVPGTYVFHRGEERGGIGSSELVRKFPEMWQKFDCAIAFDRKGTSEVIHTQGGARCASMKFTDALCKALNDAGMAYSPSDRGAFTDTKNYRSLISECVNVACGYDANHGRNETLDYAHLVALRDACLKIKWDHLPIDRDPTYVEPYTQRWDHGRPWDGWQNSGASSGGTSGKKKKAKQAAPAPAPAEPMELSLVDELSLNSLEDLEMWAEHEPAEVAAALARMVVEYRKLQAANEAMLNLFGWKH